jgi:hypothetical protein
MKPHQLAERLERIVAEECCCTQSWDIDETTGGPPGDVTRLESLRILARTIDAVRDVVKGAKQ